MAGVEEPACACEPQLTAVPSPVAVLLAVPRRGAWARGRVLAGIRRCRTWRRCLRQVWVSAGGAAAEASLGIAERNRPPPRDRIAAAVPCDGAGSAPLGGAKTCAIDAARSPTRGAYGVGSQRSSRTRCRSRSNPCRCHASPECRRSSRRRKHRRTDRIRGTGCRNSPAAQCRTHPGAPSPCGRPPRRGR